MRKYTRYIMGTDFGDVELMREYIEGSERAELLGENVLLVGWLEYDTDSSNPFEDWDAIGKIYVNSRDYGRRSDFEEIVMPALGLDRYGDKNLEAVEIDDVLLRMLEEDGPRLRQILRDDEYDEEEIDEACSGLVMPRSVWQSDWFDAVQLKMYEERLASGEIGDRDIVALDAYVHSGIHLSVKNSRWLPDREWDVTGAFWLPDKGCLEYLEEIEDPKARYAKAVEFAGQAANTYNDWANGNVYGVLVHTYTAIRDEDGELIEWEELDDYKDWDECWGHFGYDYAKEELASTMASFRKQKEVA